MPSRFRIRHRAGQLYAQIGGGDLIRQGGPLLLATVLASLAVYGFHFFASRRLGVDRYGTLASLLAVVTLILVISSAGSTIVARFAAEFGAVGDRGRLRRLFDVLARSCAILLALMLVAAFLFREQLAAFFRTNTTEFIELAAILAGFTVAATLLRGLAQGMQRFAAFSLSFIIDNVGRAAIASAAILLGFGIAGALAGQLAAGIAATVFTYAVLRRALRTAPPEALRMDFRRVAIASGGIGIASLCLAMLSYFDIVLAKHYLTAHDAGLYGFATLPGRTLAAIVSFLPTLVLPKATARAAIGTPGHGIFYAGIGAAVALLLAALGLLYAFPAAIVAISAGYAFIGAAPLIFPYGCAAALFSLTSITVSYKMGRHRFGFVVPLLLVVAGEIIAIGLFHNSAAEIVRIVLIANAVALVACAFRITAPAG